MPNTLVLVAESSRAKLYKAHNRRSPITEIDAMVHPECRAHEGDLVADRAGSDGGTNGQGRHIFDNKHSAKDNEARIFAKDLADRLDNGRNCGEFDRLILVAPPAFLGVLRDRLSKEVLDMVACQVDKNLVQKPPEVLREYL